MSGWGLAGAAAWPILGCMNVGSTFSIGWGIGGGASKATEHLEKGSEGGHQHRRVADGRWVRAVPGGRDTDGLDANASET